MQKKELKKGKECGKRLFKEKKRSSEKRKENKPDSVPRSTLKIGRNKKGDIGKVPGGRTVRSLKGNGRRLGEQEGGLMISSWLKVLVNQKTKGGRKKKKKGLGRSSKKIS